MVDNFEQKDCSILAVIRINTCKGLTEIILRDNTNIHETVDRVIAYGGLKGGDMKSYLEGYLYAKLNEAR